LRAGAGPTGSIHDLSSPFAPEVDSGLSAVKGAKSMLYVIDNALQQADINTQASPGNFDNASIWQHMSQALHQSLDRVLTQLIAVLPGLLAFFVALAIFSLAGALLAWLLRQLLGWVKFDSRFARTIKSDWAPSSSPSEIISRVLFWGCVLLGLIIGVSAFDTSYATGAALPISLLPYLTHAVGAALLLIAGILIARFLARSVLISAINAQLQYARILSLGVKWLVLVLTAAMVLDHLQIGGNVVELAFGILFGGIVLTLALAVGLGSRDLVSRSLESRVEHAGERTNVPDDASTASRTIRHF
jgi:hypothetical protein